MDDQQLLELKGILESRRIELEELLSEREESAKPVTLDQQSFGRVSRIDAIQQQQMATANKKQAELELRRVIASLTLIADDNGESEFEYGYCQSCDEEIRYERLLARPTTRFCLSCQEKSEQ